MRYFLISIDTLRYDIAEEVGLTSLFDCSHSKHYTSSNWTLPGHAAILTGDSIKHNCHWNWDFPEGDGAADEVCEAKEAALRGTTIAEAMRLRGYKTIAYAGGGFVSKWFSFDRGFDLWEQETAHIFADLPAFPDDSFIFLHDWFVHDYFQDANWAITKYRTNEFVDPQHNMTPELIQRGKISYRDRAAAMVPLVEGLLKAYPKDAFLFTSDHGEVFLEESNQIHHGVYTNLQHDWVANVPLCCTNLDVSFPEITFDVDIKNLVLNTSLGERKLRGHYSYGTTQYIYERSVDSWLQEEGNCEDLG